MLIGWTFYYFRGWNKKLSPSNFQLHTRSEFEFSAVKFPTFQFYLNSIGKIEILLISTSLIATIIKKYLLHLDALNYKWTYYIRHSTLP